MFSFLFFFKFSLRRKGPRWRHGDPVLSSPVKTKELTNGPILPIAKSSGNSQETHPQYHARKEG